MKTATGFCINNVSGQQKLYNTYKNFKKVLTNNLFSDIFLSTLLQGYLLSHAAEKLQVNSKKGGIAAFFALYKNFIVSAAFDILLL
ncbi:MAG: hypothetical protein LUF82_04690 [Clostridia bacterium]|nr:hypothetical protein [Clostridia bacterium]